MAKFTVVGKLPPPAEFQAALEETVAKANPVDDLLELAEDLHKFEQQHGISSPDFYLQYQAGMLADELQHSLEWAAIYEMFLETKHLIESTLMRAAIHIQMLQMDEKTQPAHRRELVG